MMQDHESQLAKAKDFLENILTFFGINTEVEIVTEDGHSELQVPTDEASKLIGHHGETLRALQHLVNMRVRQDDGERLYLGVDIAGYKQARAVALSEQATQAADKVASEGRTYAFRPMNAAERRVVHMALAERDDVYTESEGQGLKRFIVIKPKSD